MELSMWRGYGETVYALMTVAIFGFETIALRVLSLLEAVKGLGRARLPQALDQPLGLLKHSRPDPGDHSPAGTGRHGRRRRPVHHPSRRGAELGRFRALRRLGAVLRYPQFRGMSVDDLDSYMAARP